MGPIGKILWVGTGIAIVVLVIVAASCTETVQSSANGNSVRRSPDTATAPSSSTSDAKSTFAAAHSEAASKGIANAGLSSDFSDTLRGQVTNKYNLRDDIFKYIDDKYKDPKMRSDFLNFAIAQQDFIEYGTNREAAIRNADTLDRRLTCIYRTYGVQRFEETKIIEAMSINTESRFRAYWKATDLQSGRVTYAPRGNPCE
jgi:hypothetical protein